MEVKCYNCFFRTVCFHSVMYGLDTVDNEGMIDDFSWCTDFLPVKQVFTAIDKCSDVEGYSDWREKFIADWENIRKRNRGGVDE